jgi:hypothetical protein
MNDIISYLTSTGVVTTNDVATLFKCSSRSIHRWQDSTVYANPFPQPVLKGSCNQNKYKASDVLTWFQSLPLRKK